MKNTNFHLQETELENNLQNLSTGHGLDLSQNTLSCDRERSLPSEITNNNCNDSNKVCKKNDKKISEDIIIAIINDIIADNRSKANDKERVRFKRNYINYIIADYFSKCENKIKENGKLNKTDKRNLIKTLTSFKELIKNNSCSYKIKYLITQNNIKDLVKLLIEQTILNKKTDENTKNLNKVLLMNLDNQDYAIIDLIKVLNYKIKNVFPNSSIDLCKEINSLADLNTSNTKISIEKSPWNDKKISAIDKIVEGLNPSVVINSKLIFKIQKDWGNMSNAKYHFEDCSSSYKSDKCLENVFDGLDLDEHYEMNETSNLEFKFEKDIEQNDNFFSYGDNFQTNIYNEDLNNIYQGSPQFSLFNNCWDN